MAMRTGLLGGIQTQPQFEEQETKQTETIEPVEDREHTIIRLYSDVIAKFAEGLMFHTDASLNSHVMGLQGFKRLHRFMAFKDREVMIKLQHYVIDMCGIKIDVDWNKLKIPKYDSVKDMFSVYLEYETQKQDYLSEIYKEMMKYGFVYDAKLVSEPLCDLSKEITKCRRYIQDFSSSGWSWHHIRRVDMNLHDKYKEIEKEAYNYCD